MPLRASSLWYWRKKDLEIFKPPLEVRIVGRLVWGDFFLLLLLSLSKVTF
jgi:hypothetical protein